MKIFQIKFEIFLLDLFKTQKALTFELCFLYQFPETVAIFGNCQVNDEANLSNKPIASYKKSRN